MSFPNIPNITPTISITTAQTIPLLLSSIALEELALAHIINAEAEKLQFVLGTLPTGTALSPAVVSLAELFAVDSSVQRTLRDVIKKEMLLEFKFENVLDLIGTLPPVISTFLFVSNRNDNTVAIFDISNSQDPLFVTKFSSVDSPIVLNGPTGGPTGLAITGSTLYVANQFDNTVAIFDISFPSDPIRVGLVSAGGFAPTGLAITGNTLYASNSGDNSLVIYDITTPTDPIFVSKFGGGDLPGIFNDPNGLAITGNILYVSNSGDDTIPIFDISSPGFLSFLGQVNDGNLSGPTGLTTTGTTLYAANFNNSRVDIYDISTPSDPVHVGEFGAGDLSGPEGLAITGTTLYAANFNNSTVEIYDSTLPNDPVRIRDFGAGILNGPFGLAIFTVGG
ncbi:LVIVD repeat-containing protein [Peribacillus butanolivorans]|uniref:LVIVD repeat-containing protein n=1 Tax=Peribacillus butanolivorans TaxID=421767 RepID=UPI0036DAE965